jgi:biotin transport system substrate-specific component
MTACVAYHAEVQEKSWVKDVFAVLLGSILLSLAAPLAIRLPFSPVPIALAPQLCILMGVLLGSKRGGLAVLGYLFQGAIGLPVFALGASGIAHLCGPTGGYLLGYAAAAYLTGYLVERSRDSGSRIFAPMVAGNGAIYLLGVAQLSLFIGLKSALMYGLLPFVAGDVLKLVVVYRGLKLRRAS